MLCLFSQILVPERAPDDIKAVRQSPFKAKIEWRQIEKTEWRDSKIEYVVKYRLKYTESEYQEEVSSKSNVELNNLAENSTYTFSVYARNTAGNGPKSNEFTFSTNSCK